MSLELTIGKGRVKGNGEDRVGKFSIRGDYQDNQVTLTKTYGKSNIVYDGQWNGAMISGIWTLKTKHQVQEGVFEIWPLSDDLGLKGLADPKRIKLLVGSNGQI